MNTERAGFGLFLLVTALLLATSNAAVGAEGQPLDPDVRAYWRFDDPPAAALPDTSGQGNHGTVHGPVSRVDGRQGGAFRFNGKDTWIEVPFSPTLTPKQSMIIEVCLRPETVAGRIALGSEVRIVLDAGLGTVVPASVSFVASQAQFTPKTVETASERTKLMFRVRAQIAPELLRRNLEQVKIGVPGVAWIKLDPNAAWPASLSAKVAK